jgi:hypothetical protein
LQFALDTLGTEAAQSRREFHRKIRQGGTILGRTNYYVRTVELLFAVLVTMLRCIYEGWHEAVLSVQRAFRFDPV